MTHYGPQYYFFGDSLRAGYTARPGGQVDLTLTTFLTQLSPATLAVLPFTHHTIVCYVEDAGLPTQRIWPVVVVGPDLTVPPGWFECYFPTCAGPLLRYRCNWESLWAPRSTTPPPPAPAFFPPTPTSDK